MFAPISISHLKTILLISIPIIECVSEQLSDILSAVAIPSNMSVHHFVITIFTDGLVA